MSRVDEDQKRNRLPRLARCLQSGAMREMAAVLAHDFSQRVTVILSYATACTEAPATADPKALLETMKIIAREASSAADRLQTLKDAIRRRPRAWTSLDLNELVRDVLALFQDETEDQGIDVRLDLAPDIPGVEADAFQMQQVFLSLFRNAFEAMSDAPERLLRIRSALARDRHVEVTIRDSGAGFPAEVAEHLFDRFFTTKPGGLGLELSIARSIVEGHGGKLWAQSEPRSGATFHLRLPIA